MIGDDEEGGVEDAEGPELIEDGEAVGLGQRGDVVEGDDEGAVACHKRGDAGKSPCLTISIW
jgi:hypothetical protein